MKKNRIGLDLKDDLLTRINDTEERLGDLLAEYNDLIVDEKSEPCWKCIFLLSSAACLIGLLAINFWI